LEIDAEIETEALLEVDPAEDEADFWEDADVGATEGLDADAAEEDDDDEVGDAAPLITVMQLAIMRSATYLS
jgi:hypothetical protein